MIKKKSIFIILMFLLLLGCGNNSERKEKSESIYEENDTATIENQSLELTEDIQNDEDDNSKKAALNFYNKYINRRYFVNGFITSPYGSFAYFAKREGDCFRIIFDDDSLILYGNEEVMKFKLNKRIICDTLVCNIFELPDEKYSSCLISIIDSLNSIIQISWESSMYNSLSTSGKYISISTFDSIHVVNVEDYIDYSNPDSDTTSYYSYFKINKAFINRGYSTKRALQPYKEPSENNPYDKKNRYKNTPLIVLDTVKEVTVSQDTSYWIKAYMPYFGDSYLLVKEGDLKKLN